MLSINNALHNHARSKMSIISQPAAVQSYDTILELYAFRVVNYGGHVGSNKMIPTTRESSTKNYNPVKLPVPGLRKHGNRGNQVPRQISLKQRV